MPANKASQIVPVEEQKLKVEKFERLAQQLHKAKLGGGDIRIKKQHLAGKLTARERIALFLDSDTFVESDSFMAARQNSDSATPGDGVITGYGKVEGRLVFLYAQDFTVAGGSLGEVTAKKICKIMDDAMNMGAPLIGLNDSGGARIQEGVNSLAGYGEIFYRNVQASGVIPQIAAILGPCAGGAVYSPALMDFILMSENNSYMFVTGPDVVKAVTHEDISKEDLGGARTHAAISGQASITGSDEEDSLFKLRQLLSYLPANNMEDPPSTITQAPPTEYNEELDDLIPLNPNKPYDMKKVIEHIVDYDSFFELQPQFAKNIIIGFARLEGRVVGIIANQPLHLAGCLDIHASIKGARFVRFCDSFNIPLVTLEDVPGFLPGRSQEAGGIIRTGAKLLYAYCEATVPKVTVITRKAYGGAYIVMNSKHIRSDRCFAYPNAEIAVMGPEGAVNIINRHDIAEASDPVAKKAELVQDYRDNFATPYRAAEMGYIEEIIYPRETRKKLIQSLDMLKNKRCKNRAKKHGNIPL